MDVGGCWEGVKERTMRKRRRRWRREEGRGCHCSRFQGRWRNLKEAWREKDAKVRLTINILSLCFVELL